MLTKHTPIDLFSLIQSQTGAVWLDGGDSPTGWSILSWSPLTVSTDCDNWPQTLQSSLKTGSTAPNDAPFHGGVIGYVGYNAGATVAPIPRHDSCTEPDVWFGHYAGAACYRHSDKTWHLTGTTAFKATAQEWLSRPPNHPDQHSAAPTRLSTVNRGDYIDTVTRIKSLIESGDCYQINLTRPVTLSYESPLNPLAMYSRLRSASAPPFGALLRLSDSVSVLCNSPELLVSVTGSDVSSEPIKGTRPRNDDPKTDAKLANALRDSEKDTAELAMIVDVVRNDLGRIAATGSVRVEPRKITAHANVHHSSHVVRATLDSTHSAIDALTALFPPGSVVGAPKIRAAERIRSLESAPRGVYCGAIGFVCHTGRIAFNVAIRTAVVSDKTVRYHVGGGIVMDSVAYDEWEETVDKGSAMAIAFTGHRHPELLF